MRPSWVNNVYMLKHLFTSGARVKLLTIFLLNPDGEYYVRELTRLLDEQINSIRRELDNLKKIGLLKSRAKNRRKYYSVNKNFILFRELRNIIIKASNTSDNLISQIRKMGKPEFLLISGLFMNKDSDVDLLVVGEIEKEKLGNFLDTLETHRSIRFSTLTTQDFLYRLKCRDKFILDLIQDQDNIIGINKLEKHFA